MRNHFLSVGVITNISDVITIKKQEGSTFNKIVLSLLLEDGQILYPEIRHDTLLKVKENPIKQGDTIQFYFSLEGSQKNDKIYNNIHIHSYKVV